MAVDRGEVFSLRKRGELDKALPLARELIKEDPSESWNKRALGWLLHDLIKRFLSNDQIEDAKQFYNEFLTLDLTDEEALLIARRARRRDIEKALGLPVSPAASGGKQSLSEEARAIEKELRTLVREEPPPMSKIQELLNKYTKFKLEKPSLLHSLMLARVLKVMDRFRGLWKFIKWWDLGNLREDDYVSFTPDPGKTYPSLAEKVIKGLYKCAKKNELDSEDLARIRTFVAENHQRFRDNQWMEYYYGRLLIWTGEVTEGRKLILPMIKEKCRESWAWVALSESFQGSDKMETRRSCLSRAMLCRRNDESKIPNIRLALSRIMVEMQEYGPAKYEIQKVIKNRHENNWKISQELNDLSKAEWFKTAPDITDNRDFYRKYADQAEELLFEKKQGVVTHINRDKGIVHVALGKDEYSLLYFKDFHKAEKLQAGTFLEVSVTESRHPYCYNLHHYIIVTTPPTGSFYDEIEGTVTIRQGNEFGFVGDCFVSPQVIEESSASDGERVHVTAYYALNRKKGEYGWRAITIQKIENI